MTTMKCIVLGYDQMADVSYAVVVQIHAMFMLGNVKVVLSL